MTAVLEAARPTIARVDLHAVRHNFDEARRLAHGRDVIAVIKADAYGHGAIPVARTLERHGVHRFGVALVEEGRCLRDAGIRAEILVLGGFSPGQAPEIVALNLSAAIFHLDHAAALDQAAREADRIVSIHAKVDTGMGRLGFSVDEAPQAVARLRRASGLRLVGVMTHFADSDLADAAFTREQMARFEAAAKAISSTGGPAPIRHAANSAALIKGPRGVGLAVGDQGAGGPLYDAVRPGIMLYGCVPGPEVGGADLRPALSWTTRIMLLKRVAAETPISYARTFVTRRRSLIAVLPVGYADGFPRSLSNRGSVLIRGRRAPIVGRICMDLTMVDVTDVPDVSEGDEAVLVGSQGRETLSAESVAREAGTIPYELLCGIGSRVPRCYDGGDPGDAP